MTFRSDLDALILSLLTRGEMHGYEISKLIRELSNDALKYGEAQLYPALRRLEEAGLVTARWELQEGKPSRRLYTITDKGGGALETRKQAWKEFVESVDRILEPQPKKGEAL